MTKQLFESPAQYVIHCTTWCPYNRLYWNINTNWINMLFDMLNNKLVCYIAEIIIAHLNFPDHDHQMDSGSSESALHSHNDRHGHRYRDSNCKFDSSAWQVASESLDPSRIVTADSLDLSRIVTVEVARRYRVHRDSTQWLGESEVAAGAAANCPTSRLNDWVTTRIIAGNRLGCRFRRELYWSCLWKFTGNSGFKLANSGCRGTSCTTEIREVWVFG